jgi:hypothetical protein
MKPEIADMVLLYDFIFSMPCSNLLGVYPDAEACCFIRADSDTHPDLADIRQKKRIAIYPVFWSAS